MLALFAAMRTPEDAPTDADKLIRFGTIASVDLGAGTCTVTLDGEADVVTPPVSWLERRMGATKTWSPPSEGEQGILLCPAGEIAAGIFLPGVRSNANPMPGTSETELVQFSDGTEVSYDPQAHALAVVLSDGGTLAVTAPGGGTFTGDLAITGNLTVSGDANCAGTVTGQADVVGGGKSLKGHKHTGVSPGTAISGAPQ